MPFGATDATVRKIAYLNLHVMLTSNELFQGL